MEVLLVMLAVFILVIVPVWILSCFCRCAARNSTSKPS